MKKLLLLLALVGTTFYASAQTLPKPSPEAEVKQLVGATQIELKYSRPGVKERTVFGELVPFEELWRFGANAATNITTTHSMFFNGEELKAGTYSVFAIPSEESWKIIFNTDTKATTNSYSEEFTVLIVEGNVTENSFTESLFIGFDNIKNESADIIVLWENTKVVIPFSLNTKENAIKNIKDAISAGENLESVYYNAANFYYGSAKDFKIANKYVDQSLELGENYRNLFLKGRIMFELGKEKQAISFAKQALNIAEKEEAVGYQNFIKRTLEKWSK